MINSRERCEDTFSVVSYETDLFGKISLYAIYNRFQDLAGLHTDYLQAGYDKLRAANLAWILSKIKVRIHSLPQWRDKVNLATWRKGIDRLFELRDFCMADEKGKILIEATSAWLLVDIDNGRILSPVLTVKKDHMCFMPSWNGVRRDTARPYFSLHLPNHSTAFFSFEYISPTDIYNY